MSIQDRLDYALKRLARAQIDKDPPEIEFWLAEVHEQEDELRRKENGENEKR